MEKTKNGSKKDQLIEDGTIIVSADGDVFEELFASTPSFGFMVADDEVHKPGDTLDKYSETFQKNVDLLRKEKDPQKLSSKGQTAYANRHRMTPREWNFWSVEYRLRKNKLLVITKKGENALKAFRKKLAGLPFEGIQAEGKELYRMTDRSDGESVLDKAELNSVEVNALWTVWREFSGQRSESEGIDFIIE